MLFEDAFLQQDAAALADLFDDGAVLMHAGGAPAHGRTQVGEAIADLWGRERTYVARPRHVLQSRDLALVIADDGIHVLRRGGDGAWRSAISFLDLGVARSPDHPSLKP